MVDMKIGDLVIHTTDQNWGTGIVTSVYNNGSWKGMDLRRVSVYWYKWEKETALGICHLGVLCK
tara:strand:- start:489 stop:680 length:192 start_codon:yes stop_codon:yes gene_type:complete